MQKCLKRGNSQHLWVPVLPPTLVVPLSKFYRCNCNYYPGHRGQLCLKLLSLFREEEPKAHNQSHVIHVTQEGIAETWAHS